MNLVQPIKEKAKIEDMKKVLRSNNYRDYLLFMVGINSALRISDLLMLKWEDVLDPIGKIKNEFTVKEKKTGKARIIRVNKNLKKALHEAQAYTLINRELYIFRSRKGNNQPISRVQAWNILNDAAKTVGIKQNVGTHTLRKTFGYHAYNQGTDICLLQKVLNHSSPSVTLRYIGISAEQIAGVYINLNL